jgi:5-methylcytosine-specific restriction endonuclease McrA
VTIISGETISIPVGRQRTQVIISSMENTLAKRREWKISRGEFLRKWSRLRKALFLTDDYQSFRDLVRDRAEGLCEECSGPGYHVHHKAPVSFHPRLALVPANAKYLCRRCHRRKHSKRAAG